MHFQRLVEQDPVDPKKVKPGKIELLHPDNMDPGFMDPKATGGVKLDTKPKGLQPCLEDLLKRDYPGLLAEDRPGMPSPCDRVRVALVDLTDSRWFHPHVALWGGTFPMEAASVGKLLVVYAIHQLRFDLRVLAQLKSATDHRKLRTAARESWREQLRREDQPALDELFAWQTWDGKPDSLDFNERTKGRLDAAIRCNDNCAMSRLMIQIGFPFIGSVALQSGLWEPLVRGGLWLSATFTGKAGVRSDCPPPESCTGVIRSWTRNPVRAPKPLFAHNATALAVATFYTLLSQFRLVDPQSSLDMMTLLSGGCVSLPGLEFHTVASAKKCGILPGFRKRLKVYGCKDSRESMVTSDSALFYDTTVSPPLRYVLVVMSYVPHAYHVLRAGMKPVPLPKGHPTHHYDYRRLVGSLEWLLRRKAQFGDAC
jgi:hypothetical protein